LINYYQNHRRYVKSRDDNQLLGKTSAVSTDCQPYQQSPNGTDYTPCGAIANSKFNGWFFMNFCIGKTFFFLHIRYIKVIVER